MPGVAARQEPMLPDCYYRLPSLPPCVPVAPGYRPEKRSYQLAARPVRLRWTGQACWSYSPELLRPCPERALSVPANNSTAMWARAGAAIWILAARPAPLRQDPAAPNPL